ncbi:hypothetical protein LXL04_003742 [Taraxacum kok-saghyz]
MTHWFRLLRIISVKSLRLNQQENNRCEDGNVNPMEYNVDIFTTTFNLGGVCTKKASEDLSKVVFSILNIQKCGSNKDNLESCISVYNHAFAFPELVAIPATKRGMGGG